jgi:CRP/FNR family transcriptional regulator
MTEKSFDIACYNHLHERFQYLFEEELIDEICLVGRLRKVEADTELMSIGQKITHIPLVVSGSLKVVTEDKNGEELLLYYLELGDTCAMTLNCCSKSVKSAIAAITEEPSEILFISVEKMEEWMVKYRSWRNFVLESYNTRLNEMLEAIDNLAFNNMEERLVKYLRDRAMVMHKGELKITHLHIANDLHSSRVVISRLMKKLENEGVIKQHRNLVEVLEFQD